VKPQVRAEPSVVARAPSVPEIAQPDAPPVAPRAETLTEPRPEQKRLEAKPQAKPEPAPVARAQPRPEPPRSELHPLAPETLTEPRPEQKRLEAKPQAKPEPAPVARAQPRPEPPRSELHPLPPSAEPPPQQPQLQARAEPRPLPPTVARAPEARPQPKMEPAAEPAAAPSVPSAPGAPATPGPLRPEAGPSVNQPVAIAPLPEAPKRKKTDDNDALSRFALEIARQLGKDMRHEEYPARARAEGAGGTAQMLLRIGADGKLVDVSVANTSGHDELDQYAVEKLTRLRMPRVPAEFRGRAFTIQIPVTFAVQKAKR
jgi:protein TonB